VKAHKVKRLQPEMPLADAAERIVGVRLGELYSFVPRALDPAQVESLHDLRIAAKRLRYVLEVTGPILGPYATTAAKRARDVQDLVGEIHDCDVQLPQVLALLDELRAHDAANLRRVAGDADDLDPALSSHAPYRFAYRGLDVLATHLEARRALLFERFLALWAKLERQGFRTRLEEAITERAAPGKDAVKEEPAAESSPPGNDDALSRAIARWA
jgi:hypothetical protein